MADIVTLSFSNTGGTKYIKYTIGSCAGDRNVTFSVPSSASSWCTTGTTSSAGTISITVPSSTVVRNTTISALLNGTVCAHQINVSQASCPGDCSSITSISFDIVPKEGVAANSIVGHYTLKDGCPASNLTVTSSGISLTLNSDGTIRNSSAIPASTEYDPIALASATFKYNGITCDTLVLYQDGQLCSCDAMISSFFVNAMIGRSGTGGEVTVASADTKGCGFISATTESNVFEDGIEIVQDGNKYYLKGSIDSIPSGQQTRTADITVSYMHKGETYYDCSGVLRVTQYDYDFPCPLGNGSRTNYSGYDDIFTSDATDRTICYYTFSSLNNDNRDAYKVYTYNEDPDDDSWLSSSCDRNGCTPWGVKVTTYYTQYGFQLSVYLQENKTSQSRSSTIYGKIVNKYTGEVCWTARIFTVTQQAFDCCLSTSASIDSEGLRDYVSVPSGETNTVLFKDCVTDVLINGTSVYNTPLPLILKDSNNNDFMAFYADRYTSSSIEYMRLQIEAFSNPGTTERDINYTLTLVTDDDTCVFNLKNKQVPICNCDYIMSKVPASRLEGSVTPFDSSEGSIKSYTCEWGGGYYHELFSLKPYTPSYFGCNGGGFDIQTVDEYKNPKTYPGLSLSIGIRWDGSYTYQLVALTYSIYSNFTNQIVYFKITMYGCDYGYYKASFIGYDGGGGEPSYNCDSATWRITRLDSTVAPLSGDTYQVPQSGCTIEIAILGGSLPSTDFEYVIDSTQSQYFSDMYISGGRAYVVIPANTASSNKDFSCTVRGQYKGGDCYAMNFHFHQAHP